MEESAVAAALKQRLAAAGLELVCPLCKGPLGDVAGALYCPSCERAYPVVEGIPDLRILPDRFISFEDDRRKGQRVLELTKGSGFEAAIDAYWSITPELAPDLAARHRAHQLLETEIGAQTFREVDRLLGADSAETLDRAGLWLDAGCGTGGLLVAAGRRFHLAVGIDVAFRWLLVGRLRLREAGVDVPLVCANAEYLPFASGAFSLITANDLLEHTADPGAVLAECRRVTAADGHCFVSINNRYSLAPEPHVHLWGVGFLARGLQAAYVRAMRGHSYQNVRLLSGRELRRLARRAGFHCGPIQPAALFARHLGANTQKLVIYYNHLRQWPLMRTMLGFLGPRLQTLCRPASRT